MAVPTGVVMGRKRPNAKATRRRRERFDLVQIRNNCRPNVENKPRDGAERVTRVTVVGRLRDKTQFVGLSARPDGRPRISEHGACNLYVGQIAFPFPENITPRSAPIIITREYRSLNSPGIIVIYDSLVYTNIPKHDAYHRACVCVYACVCARARACAFACPPGGDVGVYG